MTINEARFALMNIVDPEVSDAHLAQAVAYAMDDLEKATRLAGLQVPDPSK